MENTSKALIMAAGVLIGIMLLGTYAFVIRGISIWPQSQEELVSSDQAAAFNEEYEVYKKSRMYGVDVLSCLNKAYNNNEKNDSSKEKFDSTGKKVTGKNSYNSAYVINVFVKINSPLKETVRVFYIDSSGKRREYFGTDKPSEDYTLQDTNFYPLIGSGNGHGGTFSENDLYTKLRVTDELKPTSIDLTGNGFLMPNQGPVTRTEDDNGAANVTGYYSLLTKNEMNTYESVMYGDDAKTYSFENKYDGVLEHLLEYTGHNMKQSCQPNRWSGIPPTDWVEAIWETAVLDFKTKQFKCDYIHYNPRTGLVDQIWFSEV